MAAGGPTVAYNMAGKGSTCVPVEGPKGSKFSTFRVQDATPRGFSTSGEATRGPNYRFTASHDTVVRGLSALSLRGQFQLDADSTAEESRSGSLGAVCRAPPELYRSMSPKNDESVQFTPLPSAVCGKPLALFRAACNVDFMQHSGVHSQAPNDESVNRSLLHLDVPHRTALSPVYLSNVPNGRHHDEGLPKENSHSTYNTFKSANANVCESTSRNGLDLDTNSESSSVSEYDMSVVSSLSWEASQGSDDAEIQSAFIAGDLSCSVGSSSITPRKGLSQFYAGKSRSFSCLRDVTSVKDLAKPDSPYAAKKRKVSSSNARLPPLQKGPATIAKKSMQSGCWREPFLYWLMGSKSCYA
ncbi:hypothetical protein GOP47_0020735 [Adiantum capillus-veneris]|uniref:Uncharacterized protein n=1 Tax=Adiantum capillus-veneris TaxID=13818 RepID=A0A9D4UAA0_ADICA|nr:hypothetical protein GOP47_0020735 [Adiantum capillus-veneris]